MKYSNKELDEKLVELIKGTKRYKESHEAEDAVVVAYADESIKERLGRQWRVRCMNIITLAKAIEYNMYGDVAVEKPGPKKVFIAQTNKVYLDALGSHQNVHNTIKAAKEVGMLVCISNEYKYGSAPDKDGMRSTAKKYIYNPLVKDQLLKLLESHYVSRGRTKICTNIPLPSSPAGRPCGAPLLEGFRSDIEEFIKKFANLEDYIGEFPRNFNIHPRFWELPQEQRPPYRLSSRLRKTVEGDTMEEMEDRAFQGLQGVYSELDLYRSRMVQSAAKRQLPDPFRLKMEPNLHWSRPGVDKNGNITTPRLQKIGVRAYCPFSSTTKNGGFREGWLKKNGWKSVHSHDIHSSIFRVNFFLNYGIWLPNSLDLYTVMKPGDSRMPREFYKSLAYRIYFTASPADCYMKLTWELPKDEKYRLEMNGMREALIDRIATYSRSMDNIIGDRYDNEIFLYESCIYFDCLEALMEMGLAVAPVYDCFYSDYEGIAQAVERLLPEVAGYFLAYLGWQPLTVPPTTEKILERELEKLSLNTNSIMKNKAMKTKKTDEQVLNLPFERKNRPHYPEVRRKKEEKESSVESTEQPQDHPQPSPETKGTWLDGVDTGWFNSFMARMLDPKSPDSIEQIQLRAIQKELESGRARNAKEALEAMRTPVERQNASSPSYHEIDRKVEVDEEGYRTTTIYFSNGGRSVTVDAPGKWTPNGDETLLKI